MHNPLLPKGLVQDPNRPKAKLDLHVFGSRYFTKGTAKWFGYYEELTIVEQQQLLGYFIKSAPGLNPLEKAKPITEIQLKSIEVDANFPKIEATELCRLLKLYQHYCNGFKNRPTLEVGVLLFYNPTLNKIKFLLPNQTVSGASWDWNIQGNKPILFLDPAFNPVDGSFLNIEQIQQSGWEHIGTSHSHNTIASRWSNGPTGDYKNQAGSKEKPLPPMLHLLVYAMKNYQTEEMPEFSFLSSVNVFGDLIDLDPSLVIQNTDVDYQQVNWIGGEVAEKLAKIVVYTAPKAVYAGYYQGYNPGSYYNSAQGKFQGNGYAANFVKRYLPPANDTTIVDAEATLSYLKQKLTSDPAEADYRVQLAVELVQDLSSESILDNIALLVDVLSQSSKVYSEIYDDVIKCSHILEEGFIDYFGFDDKAGELEYLEDAELAEFQETVNDTY
jgi:hypothetical protein